MVDPGYCIGDRFVNAAIEVSLGREVAAIEGPAHPIGRRVNACIKRGRTCRTRYVEIRIFHRRLGEAGRSFAVNVVFEAEQHALVHVIGTGVQRKLAEFPEDFIARDFDISAAGSEIVFDRLQVNSDLALIERTH